MLAPSQWASRYTPAQQQSLDDSWIRHRISELLRALLPTTHFDNFEILALYINGTLLRMRRNGRLGPAGIQSREDLFIGVGYAGKECYMGLLVNAPGSEGVMAFFEGHRMDIRKRDGMSPTVAIEELQERLVSKLLRVNDEIGNPKIVLRKW